MPLAPYACANCGFWQRYFAEPPACPICTDVRNDLPDDGWRFVRDEALAEQSTTSWREVAPDVFEFTTEPAFGLDGRGWLVARPEGNVAFEAAAYYDDASLARIASLGGIAWLSTSHPHGTGALWQLQDAFGPRIPLHREALQFSKAYRVTDPFDATFDLGGMHLYHVGGHYEGHSVLHDPARRALFCGDALKIDCDAAGHAVALSAHKAYHKQIPLTRTEVQRYRDVFAALDFERAYTPFGSGDVTTAQALALFDAQLQDRPFTSARLIEELTPGSRS